MQQNNDLEQAIRFCDPGVIDTFMTMCACNESIIKFQEKIVHGLCPICFGKFQNCGCKTKFKREKFIGKDIYYPENYPTHNINQDIL
jgi:hypothetical protein